MSPLGLETFSQSPLDRSDASPTRFAAGRSATASRPAERDRDELIPSVVARTHGGRFPYEFSSRAVNGYPAGVRRHVGYAFRGTNRDPGRVVDTGGFWASITRAKRSSEIPPPSPSRFVEAGKLPIEFGFKKPAQTNVFVSPYVDKVLEYGRFVYAFLVEGALNVCPGEFLVGGGIEWDAIVAYRDSHETSVWVRDGFATLDPTGCAMIRYELSYSWP